MTVLVDSQVSDRCPLATCFFCFCFFVCFFFFLFFFVFFFFFLHRKTFRQLLTFTFFFFFFFFFFFLQRVHFNFGRVMRKQTFCICRNKGAHQQRLCFRYTDSTLPLLSKSKTSSLEPFCACTARSVSDLFGNHVAGFLITRLTWKMLVPVN